MWQRVYQIAIVRAWRDHGMHADELA